MRFVVTGAAGFIGFHVARALLARGEEVVGIDSLNDYYDPALKRARLAQLSDASRFTFEQVDIADADAMRSLFARARPQRVVHLAAQAGVRHSLNNPAVYIQSNIVGFLNILEGCRHGEVEHLVYASSSSVYGLNTHHPYGPSDSVGHPASLYGATKRSNELMAHCYSHLFNVPTTGLRFFTVYGPWGRPDMSPYVFTRKILSGETIDVFNMGKHSRDFTFIDDVVEGVIRTTDHVATPNADWSGDAPDPASSRAPWRIYNIGNGNPVGLLDFIAVIERACGVKAIMKMMPMQPGDIEASDADITAMNRDIGFRPSTSITEGIPKFVEWYKTYHSI